MSALELRASLSLASIFGLRLLGMFVILPVFAIYAERLPGGDDLTLVGARGSAARAPQSRASITASSHCTRY
jgi:hypothetical protein